MRTPGLTRSRASIALTALALAAGVTACSDVRSIQPAIDSANAIELPALEGRWIIPDTAVLEVRRSTIGWRAYHVGFQDLTPVPGQPSIAPRGADAPWIWLDAQVGRVGERLVLELSPSGRMDSTLHRALSDYHPFILEVHVVVGLEVSATELRIALVNADSIETVAPALLREGACATPYTFIGRSRLLLTGTSAEVRAAYECLLKHRGLVDASVFRRSAP